LWEFFLTLNNSLCISRDEGEIVSGEESGEDDEDTKTTGLTDIIKDEFKKRRVNFVLNYFFINITNQTVFWGR